MLVSDGRVVGTGPTAAAPTAAAPAAAAAAAAAAPPGGAGGLPEPAAAVSLTELEATGREMEAEFADLPEDEVEEDATQPDPALGGGAASSDGAAGTAETAAPTAAAAGPAAPAQAAVVAPAPAAESESLSDMDDDDEIRNVILNDEEVRIKSALWLEANRDYLEQQEGWCGPNGEPRLGQAGLTLGRGTAHRKTAHARRDRDGQGRGAQGTATLAMDRRDAPWPDVVGLR